MLEAIRQKKENLFYTLILVAIIFVMLFVYGSGKTSGGKSGDGMVVATVNGESIGQREFQQVLQYRLMQYQQMLGAQYNEKLISAFRIPESTLEELINYKLMAQQAQSRGFLVSDAELADKIRSLPYYQKDGKFNAEQYLALPNRGLEENRMRQEMETTRWQGYLLSRVRLTPEQTKKSVETSQAKIELAYAKIDFNALAPTAEVNSKETEDFIKNASQEVRSYYDSHIKEFTEPAAVDLKRIRVGIPFQASDEVKAAAKKKAESIQKEVTASNFENIAKAKSDDEFAKKGGASGWVNRGSLEAPLESAIDRLKAGEVSPLIETPFGYYIVKFENKREAKVLPFEEKSQSIAKKLVLEKKKNDWVKAQRQELESLLAAGKTIEPKLKNWKVETKKTGTFNFGETNIPGIGSVDSILDGISELSKSQPIAKKLFYSQDQYYYLKLVSFEMPKEAEIEKNREAESKKIVSSLQRSLLDSWVDNLKKKADIHNELASKSSKNLVPETAEN